MEFATWKDEMEFFLDGDNVFDKEDLYKSYLDMCCRYLTELTNTINYENYILNNSKNEEEAERIIEEIASSDPSLTDLDITNLNETDQKERILNLIAHIECTLGL